MLIAAAILTASINIEIDLGSLFRAHRTKSPTVTCGIKTVGYHFMGAPGQKFRYAGENWTVPEEGWIELIADQRITTYRIGNRTLPLNDFPLNQFGFREVPIPAERPPIEKEMGQ